ncbi:uncharacterized protein LOC134443231 isoform X1 [Engraulis encrasicolus]|uniref:uncharacterized protein LOC134443231 isoform X1 n=1 Tax=Engraulis encrasicolus TaxID=184585 RepID=UPI002FCFD4B9
MQDLQPMLSQLQPLSQAPQALSPASVHTPIFACASALQDLTPVSEHTSLLVEEHDEVEVAAAEEEEGVDPTVLDMAPPSPDDDTIRHTFGFLAQLPGTYFTPVPSTAAHDTISNTGVTSMTSTTLLTLARPQSLLTLARPPLPSTLAPSPPPLVPPPRGMQGYSLLDLLNCTKLWLLKTSVPEYQHIGRLPEYLVGLLDQTSLPH